MSINKKYQKQLLRVLKKNRAELVEILSKIFRSLAFENRYTLHPRRLSELGQEETARLQSFIKTGEIPPVQEVQEQGGKRAQEGLCQRSLMEMGSAFRQFFIKHTSNDNTGILSDSMQMLDEYLNAYLEGYSQTFEQQILKNQEQLRLALSTALERQRKELYIKNSAIHTSNNGIMLTDMEDNITYVNPTFLEMWEFEKAEDVVNTKSSDFWGSKRFGEISAAMETKGGWQDEITSNHKDNTVFDVVVSASVIRDERENPIGTMAFFADVTEKNNLEVQFRQSQKMEALGQLAGGIIHDFNNLLSAVSGYAQLELMELPKNSRAYKDFMQIKTATDRGKDLTQELRIFTRQASRKREYVNLNKIIKETNNILKRTFPRDIKVEMDFDQNLKMINANPSQMNQMIMNLCVNARDAITGYSDSKNAGGMLMISTNNEDLDSARASRYLNAEPGHYVCVRVADTGMGMSPVTKEKLFEPFFTTKGETRGTGLGLAVVYGIVQHHKGFIVVRSREGTGSTFSVYLPALEQDIKSSAASNYSPKLAPGKGNILIVEDDPHVRTIILRTLKMSGYSVISAKNGLEALSLYKKHRHDIDLVLLDVVMPEMGGTECFSKLKEIDPSIKIVIITGFTSDNYADDFLDMGAIEVINKPFELEEFSKTIQKSISLYS